jgi:histidine triad (HIT) family protein
VATIFSKIVSGEIPCYKIAEDDNFLAFLDIFPLKEGHTLVIPKKEVNYLFDLEDDLYQGLFAFSKKVAKAVESVMPCERIGVAVIGLEVPHAHIHLVPIDKVQDIDFTQPKLEVDESDMKNICNKISQAYKHQEKI